MHSQCPASWNRRDHFCSRTTFVRMSFHEAREFCYFHKSDLISLSSSNLKDAIDQTMIMLEMEEDPINATTRSFWIGIYKLNDTFTWLTDSSPLQPEFNLEIKSNASNHRCSVIEYTYENDHWTWYTVDCTTYKAFPVCRKMLGISSLLVTNIWF